MPGRPEPHHHRRTARPTARAGLTSAPAFGRGTSRPSSSPPERCEINRLHPVSALIPLQLVASARSTADPPLAYRLCASRKYSKPIHAPPPLAPSPHPRRRDHPPPNPPLRFLRRSAV